ncbi:AMMECR1 domain-containing protein [Exophiala viscosa]|uniref:AMMECR1 domain-containing protein n=1 Tax=Exophiala viscosa TaxID=2486360 RepID=A0AAN6IIZ2_9EURO|nr:AMMECR1 domain-containing protein [Exophiala viscosa]
MASSAHALFCFEVLSASFERRDPPKLERVLALYDRYKSGTATDGGAIADGQGEEDIDPEAEDSEEEDDEEESHEENLDRHATPKSGPQLSSISRLKASTSSSSSSSTSSPYILSATSSTSQLTTPSSVASGNQSPPSYASRVSVTESYPLFVTWNTISRSGHKSLRGCIGTFEGMPLASGLATYALTSAFDDTRFSPIPASLLPALSCSLTLLADFEPCKDAMDWDLDTHGIRISFTNRGRRHGATYLPDVAVEQGWTKEETLESLMKKAGWDGGYGHGVARRLLRGSARGPEQQSTRPWDDVQDFRVVRYTGLKASASYDEWQAWRRWVEKSREVLKG